MFTEQDLRKLRKTKNQYYEKKEEEDRSSSTLEDKTEEYFCKYFLNDSFKIILIEISSTEEVHSSLTRVDSYMVYIIKVLTEQFSYEVKRRYSEFLKLHDYVTGLASSQNRVSEQENCQQIRLSKMQRNLYAFPAKRLSSSLRHFFNICSKQKLAQERKSELCSFLNQIRNNYYKFPDQFVRDYVELLKFINMKEEHQKFWRRKEGRLLEISNVVLKDSNAANQAKVNQKPTDSNCQTSIQHLVELLQHQINKINLAIAMKQGFYKSSPNLGTSAEASSQMMIADEIIKNIDCMRNIVLEMKRKINYDHIRCILKGKDLKPAANSMTKSKKGLIEYCLKHTVNQLVAMHILRTILDIFLNPECNYSCDGFLKVLSELEIGIFALGQEKQLWALYNKDFRQAYFKLIKQYCLSKQLNCADKKSEGFEKVITQKIMSINLAKHYQEWDQMCLKNKQFKAKDQQKQWTLVIENLPSHYSPKSSRQPCFISADYFTKIKSTQDQKYIRQSYSRNSGSYTEGLTVKFAKAEQNDKLKMALTTSRVEDYYVYLLTATTKQLSYKQCLELMKCQQKWNPLLLHSQTDVYSSTRKDCLSIPGKQDKIFRFTEHQQIQLDLHQQNQALLQSQDNFIAVDNYQQIPDSNQKNLNPKSSTQTMPSTNGSCAQDFLPEGLEKQPVEDLAESKLSRKTTLMKVPPSSGSFNSYYQQVRVQRGDEKSQIESQLCHIEIQLIFTEPAAYRYFSTELDGSSLYIWTGVQKCLQQQTF